MDRLREEALLVDTFEVLRHRVVEGEFVLIESEVLLTLPHPGRGRFRWRGVLFRATRSPIPLAKLGKETWAVQAADIHGILVPLTSIERSIVDAVARPGLGGGWEEIDQCVGSVSYLRADLIGEYLRLLGSSVLAARVGFLLERHAESLGLEAKQLDEIAEMRPKSKVYLDGRKRESGRLMKRWNLPMSPPASQETLVALITRQAARNLFDSKELLLGNDLDLGILRTPLVVYGAMSPFDWRLATPAKVGFRAEEFVRLIHEEGTVNGSVLGLNEEEAELVESLPGLRWRALGGARGGAG